MLVKLSQRFLQNRNKPESDCCIYGVLMLLLSLLPHYPGEKYFIATVSSTLDQQVSYVAALLIQIYFVLPVWPTPNINEHYRSLQQSGMESPNITGALCAVAQEVMPTCQGFHARCVPFPSNKTKRQSPRHNSRHARMRAVAICALRFATAQLEAGLSVCGLWSECGL
jgi:hypothetical protein